MLWSHIWGLVRRRCTSDLGFVTTTEVLEDCFASGYRIISCLMISMALTYFTVLLRLHTLRYSLKETIYVLKDWCCWSSNLLEDRCRGNPNSNTCTLLGTGIILLSLWLLTYQRIITLVIPPCVLLIDKQVLTHRVCYTYICLTTIPNDGASLPQALLTTASDSAYAFSWPGVTVWCRVMNATMSCFITANQRHAPSQRMIRRWVGISNKTALQTSLCTIWFCWPNFLVAGPIVRQTCSKSGKTGQKQWKSLSFEGSKTHSQEQDTLSTDCMSTWGLACVLTFCVQFFNSVFLL